MNPTIRTEQYLVFLSQLTAKIDEEMSVKNIALTGGRIATLVDAQEYIRRAAMVLAGLPIVINDTDAETQARKSKEA